MSNTPDVQTDWAMWDNINSSLEIKKKNRFLPILIGLPFIVFFSGLLGYLLAPNQGNVIANNIEVERDTIYITKTFNSVDTVFKTEIVTQWRDRASNQHLQLLSQVQSLSNINHSLQKRIDDLDAKLDDYRYAFNESNLIDNPKYQHFDFFKSGPIRDNFIESETPSLERRPIGVLAISPRMNLKMLDYKRPQIKLISDLWFENLVKNRKSDSFIDHIVPDYVNIGISAEAPGLTFIKNLSPGSEAGIGLNVEFMFSPRFSLNSGIRSRSTQNKTEDELIASSYPQPSVTMEESFKNLKVKSSFIDIPFTFKYNMFKREGNKIYLTGGVLLSKHNQTEYVYEYVRGNSEIYYEEKTKGKGWSLGSSIFGLGFEFDTWRNTSAFVESNLRYQFKNEKDAIHGIGFRFGLYYKI